MAIGLTRAGIALKVGADMAAQVQKAELQDKPLLGWTWKLQASLVARERIVVVVVLDLTLEGSSCAARLARSLHDLSGDVCLMANCGPAGFGLDLRRADVLEAVQSQAEHADWDLVVVFVPGGAALFTGRDVAKPWGVASDGGADKKLKCEVENERLTVGLTLADSVLRNGGAYALVCDNDVDVAPWDFFPELAALALRTGGMRMVLSSCVADRRRLFSVLTVLPVVGAAGAGDAPQPMCALSDAVRSRANDYLRDGSGCTGALQVVGAAARTTRWSRRAGPAVDPSKPTVAFLNEDSEARRQTVIGEDQQAYYLHVDDGVTISSRSDGPCGSNALMHLIAEGWQDVGFIVADRREAHELAKVVG